MFCVRAAAPAGQWEDPPLVSVSFSVETRDSICPGLRLPPAGLTSYTFILFPPRALFSPALASCWPPYYSSQSLRSCFSNWYQRVRIKVWLIFNNLKKFLFWIWLKKINDPSKNSNFFLFILLTSSLICDNFLKFRTIVWRIEPVASKY